MRRNGRVADSSDACTEIIALGLDHAARLRGGD